MRTRDLSAKYEKLTPFERAVMLVRECCGRQRKSMLDALQLNPSPEAAYWTEKWRWAIVTTATTTFSYAKDSLLRGWLLSSSTRVKLGPDPKPEEVAEALEELEREEGLARALVQQSVAWIRALRQLETETGVPFTEVDGVFGLSVIPMVDLIAVPEDLDHEQHYRAIRQTWDAFWRHPNREDEHRRLTPVEPVGNTIALPRLVPPKWVPHSQETSREDGLCRDFSGVHRESQAEGFKDAQRPPRKPPRRSSKKGQKAAIEAGAGTSSEADSQHQTQHL